MKKEVDSVFWFRRDLRLHDNKGLFEALSNSDSVLPVFIFDKNILSRLKNKKDKRVSFIYDHVCKLKESLKKEGSDLAIFFDKPENVFEKLTKKYNLKKVYTNKDYDPYSKARDRQIKKSLENKNIFFQSYKDHVIFEENEILKKDSTPYLIYTPYWKKWKEKLSPDFFSEYKTEKFFHNLQKEERFLILKIEYFGFEYAKYHIQIQETDGAFLKEYNTAREIPSKNNGTSRLSVALRFGVISTREIVRKISENKDETFLKEIAWREFFHMLLFHFPKMKEEEMKEKYKNIPWSKNKQHLEKWKKGKTGFLIVDAGMRELNETGYMHNRVRMITSSFLVKILKIDWREGEKYFAEKLLDYEMASNAGNWQWAAGSGTDSAPYFRIFNPYTQIKKFDPDYIYIKKWIPQYEEKKNIKEIVDYKEERVKTLALYKKHLLGNQ
jgi:deoxyribodipyrimidine photo-lyase